MARIGVPAMKNAVRWRRVRRIRCVELKRRQLALALKLTIPQARIKSVAQSVGCLLVIGPA